MPTPEQQLKALSVSSTLDQQSPPPARAILIPVAGASSQATESPRIVLVESIKHGEEERLTATQSAASQQAPIQSTEAPRIATQATQAIEQAPVGHPVVPPSHKLQSTATTIHHHSSSPHLHHVTTGTSPFSAFVSSPFSATVPSASAASPFFNPAKVAVAPAGSGAAQPVVLAGVAEPFRKTEESQPSVRRRFV